MRRSRNSTSDPPGERGGRLLLHLGHLKDVRPIGALEAPFLWHGFLRTHRNYLVNPRHVRQIRRRPQGEDWELTLDPPVNAVLPVSRSALAALWAAFGED